ncbi:MAG TPA: monovalent cation/H(+) antiporter subunit G [Thermomicrobiales bacterium]|nr:monovalent cation/H(+) antiporter subunit G [Thermomicrobiales bacterium]
MIPYVFDALVVLGVAVMTLGIIGIIRMPDLYTKLHGASKSVFLGVTVLAVSGMVIADSPIITRLVLISLTLLITTPVASHVIGRAGYLMHEQMDTPGAIDESGTIRAQDEQPAWSRDEQPPWYM